MIEICKRQKEESDKNENEDFYFGGLVFGEVALGQFAVFDVDVGESDRCEENETVQNGLGQGQNVEHSMFDIVYLFRQTIGPVYIFTQMMSCFFYDVFFTNFL
jgi:hypothetical protein